MLGIKFFKAFFWNAFLNMVCVILTDQKKKNHHVNDWTLNFMDNNFTYLPNFLSLSPHYQGWVFRFTLWTGEDRDFSVCFL